LVAVENGMDTAEQARLAVELEYYSQHKDRWLKEAPGKYVVIKAADVLGFYETFEAAYRAGAAAYGIRTDFLVKQILEHEPVFFVF
jgi:hypothetical protein